MNKRSLLAAVVAISACGPMNVLPDGGAAGGSAAGGSAGGSAAGGSAAGGSAAGGSAAGGTAVSFMTQVGPLIQMRCGGCHGLADVAAANTWVRGNADRPSCMAQGARITANDAANSLIVKKVSGTQTCGARMPFGCTPGTDCLTDAQIALIRDWINAGAPNN